MLQALEVGGLGLAHPRMGVRLGRMGGCGLHGFTEARQGAPPWLAALDDPLSPTLVPLCPH